MQSSCTLYVHYDKVITKLLQGVITTTKEHFMECCFCQKEIEPLLDHNFEVVKLPNGKPAWDKGYSAEPLVENGRCCMHCNDHRVLPARIRNSFAK